MPHSNAFQDEVQSKRIQVECSTTQAETQRMKILNILCVTELHPGIILKYMVTLRYLYSSQLLDRILFAFSDFVLNRAKKGHEILASFFLGVLNRHDFKINFIPLEDHL